MPKEYDSETCNKCASYRGNKQKGRCCFAPPVVLQSHATLFPTVYGEIDYCSKFLSISDVAMQRAAKKAALRGATTKKTATKKTMPLPPKKNNS